MVGWETVAAIVALAVGAMKLLDVAGTKIRAWFARTEDIDTIPKLREELDAMKGAVASLSAKMDEHNATDAREFAAIRHSLEGLSTTATLINQNLAVLANDVLWLKRNMPNSPHRDDGD